jgi:hypothetical protein
MRTSTMPLALVTVAILSVPAQAAKFSCTFYSAGAPVSQPCTIDTANPSAKCQHAYPQNLYGTCLGNNPNIGCIFSYGPLVAGEAFATSDAKVLSPQPGFLSGAVAEASTKRFQVGYKENNASSELDALCLPAN